jgi:hypothetical protein
MRLAGGGEAEGELTAGSGGGGAGAGTCGGAGGVGGGSVGGGSVGGGSVGRGAAFLGALEVRKPVNSGVGSGALGPETAALQRRRQTRGTGATKAERGGDREAESDTSCRPAV